MVQSPRAPRESWARSERCRDDIRGRRHKNQSLRRGGDGGGGGRVRGLLIVVIVVVIIHTREGIIPLLCNAAVEYCVRIIYVYVG